jgi:hypothetical protein
MNLETLEGVFKITNKAVPDTPPPTAHHFPPGKRGSREVSGGESYRKANFTAVNPSCPPLVRGGTER